MSPKGRADLSLGPALSALSAIDVDIANTFKDCGLPPVRREKTGFPGLARIVVAQQVSVASAAAITRRLHARVPRLTPRAFLTLSPEDHRSIGFSGAKSRYLTALARDLETGRIDLKALAAMDDEAAIAHLLQAKGLGRWSAEIYLLFSLRRPDIMPAGDLALRVAAQRMKRLPTRPSETALREMAEAWRPYRSAAARFLWHAYRHPGLPQL